MKKKFVQLFAAMLALVCLLSLSACSGGGESSAPSESSASSTVEESQSESSESQAEQSALEAEEEAGSAAQSEAEAVASAEEEAAGEVTGMYSSIEEFVNSDIVQTQLEAMQPEELGVDVLAEGNKLIYEFTYGPDVNTEGIADALSAALQEQASTFELVAQTLKAAVDVENPVVVVTYKDSQGNVIVSQEFTTGE